MRAEDETVDDRAAGRCRLLPQMNLRGNLAAMSLRELIPARISEWLPAASSNAFAG